MTTNHPAHGPVSLDRLHQIREILNKAAAQSDGGNLGYAMADAVKVIDGAIAALGAEPAGYADPQALVNFKSMGGKNAACTKEWMWRDPYNGLIPLYTAPPAPVSVPAAMEMDDDFDSAFEHGKAVGWNACRAALLQAGNSPVTPDGYVLVPKELTCEMDDAAWGAYHETRCMSDIWAALLAAAPKQEVKAALEHGMQRYPELCKNCQKGISDG
ncbi:TPA: hypothetical protein ACNROV_003945 [Citrobacter freundii]